MSFLELQVLEDPLLETVSGDDSEATNSSGAAVEGPISASHTSSDSDSSSNSDSDCSLADVRPIESYVQTPLIWILLIQIKVTARCVSQTGEA